MSRLILLLTSVAFTHSALAQQVRTFTDQSGRKLQAELLGVVDGLIEIKRSSDGQVFQLPLENFSDADQAFVKAQMKAPNGNPSDTSVGVGSFQVGDPNPQFDESKFDPAYPQMQAWRLAGVSTGIPILRDQLTQISREFEAGATEEDINRYLESPEAKYKQVVVLLKNGTYEFTNKGIRLFSSGTLIGESRDGVIIHCSGEARISLYNARGAGVRNLTLIGKWKDTDPDPLSFTEDLPGMDDHRMVNLPGSEDCFVDNVRIVNSACHPIWVGGSHNTIRNLEVDGAYCKSGGCQGYFFIDGQRNLITGCRVTRIRHISMQNPSCKENVFYGNDVRQEFSFHSNDGGDNLIENNRFTIPKELTNYNAIMGPWSVQHQVGGLNFIYNNQCKEEHSRKTPWSDNKLYTGPHFISNQQGKERYENFKPVKTPLPIGGTLYPIIVNPASQTQAKTLTQP
jgi:hypothetical protein